MSLKRIYIRMLQFLLILFCLYLIIAGTVGIFAIIYSLTTVVLLGQMWMSKNELNTKIFYTIVYVIIIIAQQVLNTLIVFAGIQTGVPFFLKKLIATIFVFLPLIVIYVNYIYTLHDQFYFTSKDSSVLSFEIIKVIQSSAGTLKDSFIKNKDSLRVDRLFEIAKDIPRHSYTKYLNKNTLTEEFFHECKKSLQDEHLYIVISSTGSSASELISVFTQKAYNHVSLSFDSQLKTILSYNGGENVYPPGLNKEQLKSFHKKDDASIIVYRIKAPKEKKQVVIDKIREINETGSAYNLIGLVTKISLKPNIMFCSQFVYSILKAAGLEYFESTATNVKPTDLIEKDYYRKLDFCYEIKFNEL